MNSHLHWFVTRLMETQTYQIFPTPKSKFGLNLCIRMLWANKLNNDPRGWTYGAAAAAVTNSVNWWQDCVFNIWPFSVMKICPNAYKLYQIELKNCKRFLNIGQSGGISPNLVTLVTNSTMQITQSFVLPIYQHSTKATSWNNARHCRTMLLISQRANRTVKHFSPYLFVTKRSRPLKENYSRKPLIIS